MRLLIAAFAFLCSSSIFSQSASSPDLPGALTVQVGFNFLIDNPENMSTDFWGSKAFNAYYMYSVRFGESAVSFHPGFGIGTDKYSFEEDVTLERNLNRTVSMVPLEMTEFGEVKKTKLAVTHFEVPLELRFHFNKDNFKKSIKLAVGGKLGLLLSSHTKVKSERLGEGQKLKVKDDFELSRFTYGVQGSLGYAGIAAYFYYGLNEMFKTGRGPDGAKIYTMQTGISISVF